ncbi:tellurite resistance/C4-dicarboxylate transporter family protein [Eoetvoesia caeni]|nr:tellurite resistance/C4-dicarboxylate transporter family protein [Eoetvoesiella caeni]
MSPAYFGVVMATGIVSLAADMMGMASLAQALFGLNVVLYAGLWVLTLVRAVCYSQRFFSDLFDHVRAWGFFTMVAASCILGEQFLGLAANEIMGWALWAVSLLLWCGLTYTVFVALIIKTSKPSIRRGIHGGWLLAVVATQALASLTILLVPQAGAAYKDGLAFFSLTMWLWGGMLYIWMAALIFYRDMFFRFAPADLVPPYWINMGAMAISALTGTSLITLAAQVPYLTEFAGFLKGFTVLFWATGTWWIPMLVVLELWRHGYKHFPLKYDALYWGAVFPLGMYAASTHQVGAALGLDFLRPIATVFLYLALAAWALTFAAWVVTAARRLRRSPWL